ncbi:MAG: hypothetical protein AAGC81_14075 [Pseudomonadota bacterium]
MKTKTASAFLGVVIGLAAPFDPAYSAPKWACLEPALKTELAHKLTFQGDFASLISEMRPELAEVAALNAATAKMGFEMRYSRIVWIWQEDPSRLSDPDAFWAFAWSDEDTKAWREASAEHASMHDRVEALKTELTEHQDTAALREFASELRKETTYVDLLTEFGAAVRSDRDRVAECY